jgi:hypothetical protein
MQPTMMMKQVLAFNKKAFDDSFNAIIAVQEHAEKMVNVFWGNSTFFPEAGKKAIGEWVNTYKNGLDDFKANVDSRFKLIESYLLNVADQMEFPVNAHADKTLPVKSVVQVSKKVVADMNKAVPGKRVLNKEKVNSKKTNKQK